MIINNFKFVLFFLISFGIVAFGQPGWVPMLAPLAAFLGYAFFWKSLDPFSSNHLRFWISAGWYSCVQMIQLSWMTATEYQGSYILFVFASLSFLLGLQFGVLTLFIPKKNTGKISYPRIFAVASFWTVLEWVRLHFLCGFSWNPAGMALTSYIPSMQLAAVWGVLGLSFWVILANLLVYKNLFLKSKAAHYPIAIAVVVFPYIFGWMHISSHSFTKSNKNEPLSVVLVQTGLLPPQKAALYDNLNLFVSPYDQWHRIISFLKPVDQEKCDLIVLPEAAVPFHADQTLYSLEVSEKILCSELGETVRQSFPPLQLPYAKMKQVQGKGGMVSFQCILGPSDCKFFSCRSSGGP